METKEKWEKKKKRWKLGVVFGVVFLIMAVAALIWGSVDQVESEIPEDLYFATAGQQYVYAPVQYLSEAFGSYESYEKMSLYFAFNENWEPYIICMEDKDAAQYADLIAYTYGMLDDAQAQDITGYSVPIDYEMRDLAIECYNELFEEEYADAGNFEDLFGGYYMQVGAKASAYTNFNTFIILLAVGVALLAYSLYQVKKYGKAIQAADREAAGTQNGEEGISYGMTDMFTEQNVKIPGEVKSHNRALGILGAFGGALIGSVLIVVIGLLGYVSGWAAVAMALLAINGYKWLAKGIDKAGIALSIVITALMLPFANLIQIAIAYYQSLNEMMGGYVSFWRALQNTPQFMTDYEVWGSYWQNVVMGYLLGGICMAFWVPGIIRGKKQYDFSSGYQPQNVYSEPDAFGERKMCVTLKMPKTNGITLRVMGFIFLIFGLFLGLALGVSDGVAEAAPIFIMFAIFAVLMFWLAKMTSGITYTADEWGVHWYRPFGKKQIDIAYSEITRLEMNRAQCRIFTADKKKKIAVAFSNFKNAQDFAYVVQTCYHRLQEQTTAIEA